MDSTMPTISCEWELGVERGPNWLLVKVGQPLASPWEMPPLADTLKLLMEEHFTYRLVLELDDSDLLSSELIGEFVALDKWIRERQGVMRLCGLSPHNGEVLRRCWLDGFVPTYRDRLEAVRGCHRRLQPG
jgi:anti-anti-sigma regulatory factor